MKYAKEIVTFAVRRFTNFTINAFIVLYFILVFEYGRAKPDLYPMPHLIIAIMVTAVLYRLTVEFITLFSEDGADGPLCHFTREKRFLWRIIPAGLKEKTNHEKLRTFSLKLKLVLNLVIFIVCCSYLYWRFFIVGV